MDWRERGSWKQNNDVLSTFEIVNKKLLEGLRESLKD